MPHKTLTDILQEMETATEKISGGFMAKLEEKIMAKAEEIIQAKAEELFAKMDNSLPSIIENLKEAKGEKGDSPVLGADYTVPTVEEISAFILPKIKVPKPKDGKTPIVGVDFPFPKDGKTPVKGIDYNDGANGSPDGPEEVRDKLASLKDENRLDASAIKNLPTRSPLVSIGKSFHTYHKVIYPSKITGTIDGANTVFYLPEAPKRVEELELMLDNTIQEPTQNFTLTGNRVDMTFAPQTGQRMWGRIYRP